jgi:fucose permease
VSLGIAASNTIVLIAVFRFKTQDGKSYTLSYISDIDYVLVSECLVEIGQPVTEEGTSSDSTFRQILSQKTVHLLAFFILVYVGVEVTVGGS